MRIGIDCRTILSTDTGELAGTAHYTTALVAHLLQIDKENTYVLFFDARANPDRYRQSNVEIVTLRPSRLPLVMTHVRLTRALTRAKLDLFHSPAHPLPLFYRGRIVWTVHDVTIYDHPEWFPGGLRQWFSMRVTVPRGIDKAAKLIAPSESTRRDILRIFKVPEEKVTVVHEGAPTEFSISNFQFPNKSQFPIFKPYFLFIGTIEPRKNLVRLIDAFIRFRQTYNLSPQIYDLVIAGASGWKNDDVFMQIERANLKLGKGTVQYLGYVSEEEKIALLKNATAFIWPSLYEGFGLPVLEAMAAGAPVITSKVSSIPEITGDAALLVDPENMDAITEAMRKIVSDDVFRDQLKTRGVNRAKEFTWEKAAKETLAVYQGLEALKRE